MASHMPHLETRRESETLDLRYARAKQLAHQWMERHRATVTRLADFIDVDRTCLSRFLNGVEGFQPTATRPAMLRILEGIESRCAVWNLVEHLDVQSSRRRSGNSAQDDEQVWYENHTVRLHYLLEQVEPMAALGMMSELTAQAVHAPLRYRAAMCTNVLLAMAGIAPRAETASATRLLLRESVARVLRLEQTVRETASEEFLAERMHKPVGYAGHALAFVSLNLEDDVLLQQGVDRLFAAATSRHELNNGHWPNLFRVLDHLLEIGHDGARVWAEKAARLAATHWDEKVRYTLSTRVYPRLLGYWTEGDAKVVALYEATRVRGGRGEEATHEA